MKKFKVIDIERTGKNIHHIMTKRGLKPTDIQLSCNFTSTNTIYKWFHGKCLPSLDNLVLLAQVLEVTLDEIVITKNLG